MARSGNQTVVQALGSVAADQFKQAWLEIGAGSDPQDWKRVGNPIPGAVDNGVLTEIPATEFAGASTWMLRVIIEHNNGQRRESRFLLNLN